MISIQLVTARLGSGYDSLPGTQESLLFAFYKR
jgi:hypothetical protein